MKITTYFFTFSFAVQISALSEIPFDPQSVQQHRSQLLQNLETNSLVAAWKTTENLTSKQTSFNEVVQEIAGTVLEQQWSHPSGGNLPLVDWAKVSGLEGFFPDQRSFIEATNSIAQTDEDLAKVLTLMELLMGLGSEADVWFEDWLLELAKGSNHNLKHLSYFAIRGFGEDISRKTGQAREIDWTKWEAAYSLCDNLGKAILLSCISDLSLIFDEFTCATNLHLAVLNGDSEELMAISLDHGTKKLGDAVVAKWQIIANQHANPKLQLLASEALVRE